jgi:hypothetical protein
MKATKGIYTAYVIAMGLTVSWLVYKSTPHSSYPARVDVPSYVQTAAPTKEALLGDMQDFICAVHVMKLGFMQTTYDYAGFDTTTKRCINRLK